MAKSDVNTMDLLKEQMKEAATDQLAVLGDLRKLSEEELKETKASMQKDLERDGLSKGVAEELVGSFIDSNIEQNKILETNRLATEAGLLPEQVAAKKRQEMVDKFGEFGATLRSSIGGLGDAIKEDFGQLTVAFQALDQIPGFKTIKALLKLVTVTLGKLLLQAIKNSKFVPKGITDRISKDKDGINIANTLRNFTPDALLFSDEKKAAKDKDIKDTSFDKVEKKTVGKPAVKDTFLQKANKKFTKSTDAMKKGMSSISESFMRVGGKGLGKVTTLLKAASASLMGGLVSLGTTLMAAGTSLMAGATAMRLGVMSLVGGMLASAASILMAGIMMLAPVILIAIGVAAIIFGIMYLKDKLIENKDMIMARWEMIKEGFSIMMDGLFLWKDKSVAFIKSIFSKIGLGIQSMIVSILEGIENGINWVINGLNDKLGWAGVDLDTVDIGASGMRADYESEKADFEVAQQEQSDEFAAREKDLADRKQNNTMERGMNIVNQNNVQNDAPSSTMIVPDGTSPGDQFAGNIALAQ